VEAHAALRALMRAKMSDVAGLDISEQVQREVTMLLRAYLAFHVPGRIRALDFFAAGR
jgi:hypothetical protein